MSKQQTAVEWLEFEITKRGPHENNPPQWLIELYEQAKEMEKEQMIEFAQEVFRNRYNQITQSLGNIADDIYNENYGE
jgi:hypothetical protein